MYCPDFADNKIDAYKDLSDSLIHAERLLNRVESCELREISRTRRVALKSHERGQDGERVLRTELDKIRLLRVRSDYLTYRLQLLYGRLAAELDRMQIDYEQTEVQP